MSIHLITTTFEKGAQSTGCLFLFHFNFGVTFVVFIVRFVFASKNKLERLAGGFNLAAKYLIDAKTTA